MEASSLRAGIIAEINLLNSNPRRAVTLFALWLRWFYYSAQESRIETESKNRTGSGVYHRAARAFCVSRLSPGRTQPSRPRRQGFSAHARRQTDAPLAGFARESRGS